MTKEQLEAIRFDHEIETNERRGGWVATSHVHRGILLDEVDHLTAENERLKRIIAGMSSAMTDRYHSLTVVLLNDMRTDDAEPLMDAIRQMRGVLRVDGVVMDSTGHMAFERARGELGAKLWDVLYPKGGK